MNLKIIFLYVFFNTAFVICGFAQDDNKTVSITVSGYGKTSEDAKNNCFRSAIEQAFGAFISSKTEVLNDKIISDEVTSISNGNIQSFNIINESQLPDGVWGITLKAVVSINNLTNFVKSKGIAVEVKGSLFAVNIKQQILNEKSEIEAIVTLVGHLHELLQLSYDYNIKSGEPQSLDTENKNWEIPLEVTAIANKNMDFCANYCMKTLSAVSLNSDEIIKYLSINKPIYKIKIKYNGLVVDYYFRKEATIDALFALKSQWEFYTRGYIVYSELGQSEGIGNGKIKNLTSWHDSTLIFLASGENACSFKWQEKCTLTQIEQITSFNVKPTGVRSQFKQGGIVVTEKDGHGLVASLIDLGKMKWYDAKNSCSELVLNGYTDWFLPDKNQLDQLYLNLYKKGIGGFFIKWDNYDRREKIYENAISYWSSTSINDNLAWIECFQGDAGRKSPADGVTFELNKQNGKIRVRAVRVY